MTIYIIVDQVDQWLKVLGQVELSGEEIEALIDLYPEETLNICDCFPPLYFILEERNYNNNCFNYSKEALQKLEEVNGCTVSGNSAVSNDGRGYLGFGVSL